MEPLRAGTGLRPEVHVTVMEGQTVVVKDFRKKSFFFRALIGAWLVSRECAMYRRLFGIPGVPKFYRRLDRYSFAYCYVSGRDCASLKRGQLGPVFFEKLTNLVAMIHSHGVAHCDLKPLTNFLLGADNEPYLIDFAAAFTQGPRWNVVQRWLFGQLCITDWRGVAKLKKFLAPDLMSDDDRAILENPTFMEKLARFFLGR